MNRRIELQDSEDTLQRQTWYLEPERYRDLFMAGAFDPEPLTLAGRDVEEVVNDVNELDAYFDQLEQKRSINGGMVLDAISRRDGEGWL